VAHAAAAQRVGPNAAALGVGLPRDGIPVVVPRMSETKALRMARR
jgi:hypothetical protein